MSKEDEAKQAAEYLVTLALQKGFAVSTVKDGTILIFKRSAMQDLINQHPDKELLQIFVQQPPKSPLH